MNIIRHFESIATRVLHSQPPSQPYSPPSSQSHCEQPKSRGGSVREIHFQINLYQPEWTRNRGRRRKLIVSLVLALVLIPTALVIAQVIFSDVPPGHIFYDDIYAIYRARITTGTTPTTYSPEDPVTRGQMAAFLHRGLGRIAYDSHTEVNLGTADVDLAVISLITGGAPGGTGFVKLDGVVSSYTSSNATIGCPCLLRFWISAGGLLASHTEYIILNNASSGVQSATSGAITWALSVPTGTVQTFRLKARFFSSAGQIPGTATSGTLTAIYAPFGSTGGNTLNAASASPDDAPPGTEPDAKPDAER